MPVHPKKVHTPPSSHHSSPNEEKTDATMPAASSPDVCAQTIFRYRTSCRLHVSQSIYPADGTCIALFGSLACMKDLQDEVAPLCASHLACVTNVTYISTACSDLYRYSVCMCTVQCNCRGSRCHARQVLKDCFDDAASAVMQLITALRSLRCLPNWQRASEAAAGLRGRGLLGSALALLPRRHKSFLYLRWALRPQCCKRGKRSAA